MKRMRITHSLKGTVARVEVDMEGFTGPQCKEFSAPFERLLGVDEAQAAREDKPELHQAPDAEAAAS